MHLAISFAIIFVCSIILAKSADLVVKIIIKLAKRFRVSEFNIGFFVLGLATTTPEIFIGINSILDNQPTLSLGNLIGASIILLSFIIGISAVINKQIAFIHSFSQRDIWLTSFVIFAPAFLLIDQSLSSSDGLFLLVIYVLFYLIMNKRQTFTENIIHTLGGHHNNLIKLIFELGLCFIGLFLSSKLIVSAAEYIAQVWQLPLVLMGLIFIAIGTNLPELTVMIRSARSHHKQIAIGGLLGSAVANTPVLGLVAILKPIAVDAPVRVYFSLAMLFLTLILFNAFFTSEKKLTRIEGCSLISLYLFFLFLEIFLFK